MSPDQPGLDGARHPAETTRLFGHDHALTFLAETYRAGHLHHALLLEGPQGIGKATPAFRFACHMLTHPQPGSAPKTCPQGPPCRLIGSSSRTPWSRPGTQPGGQFKVKVSAHASRFPRGSARRGPIDHAARRSAVSAGSLPVGIARSC